MTIATIKVRPVGAVAELPKNGHVHIVTATGGELDVTTRPSEAGFSPIDLLHASLAACLALSARIAASRLGVLDRIGAVRVRVGGDKAEEGPSRIGQFRIDFEIDGDIDDALRHAIIEAAEGDICTVSNTLRGAPDFVTNAERAI